MNRSILASRFAVGASVAATALAMASVSCRDQSTGPGDGERGTATINVQFLTRETPQRVDTVAFAPLDSFSLSITPENGNPTTYDRGIRGLTNFSITVPKGRVDFRGRIFSGRAAIYACDKTLNIEGGEKVQVDCKRIAPQLAVSPRIVRLNSNNGFLGTFRIMNIHPDSGGLNWQIDTVKQDSAVTCAGASCPLIFEPNRLVRQANGAAVRFEPPRANIGAGASQTLEVRYPSSPTPGPTATYTLVLSSWNNDSVPAPLGDVKVLILTACDLLPKADAGHDTVVVLPIGVDSVRLLLDGSGSKGCDLEYAWSAASVRVSPPDSPRAAGWFKAAVHKVTLTVTDPVSKRTDSDTVRIEVQSSPNPSCVADAGPDIFARVAGPNDTASVPLDGSRSTGTALSYHWSPSNDTVPRPTVRLPVGIHTFTLTVTTGSGQVCKDTVVVTVSHGCPPPPVPDAGRDTVVEIHPDSNSAWVRLDGTRSTGVNLTYEWFENGKRIATGPGPDSVRLAVGTHTIVLRVTQDVTGCPVQTSTDTVSKTVIRMTRPNKSPVADAGPDQEVLDSLGLGSVTVMLDGSGSYDPDGAIVKYEWSGAPVAIDTVVRPTVSLPLGIHQIVLKVTDNGNPQLSDSDAVVVTVATKANIDIRPIVNCNPNNVIPVFLLTTPHLNALTVDHPTVFFGRMGTEATEIHNGPHTRDVNGDGNPDLVFHFRLGETGLLSECGSPGTIGKLRGHETDGSPFLGTDTVDWVGS